MHARPRGAAVAAALTFVAAPAAAQDTPAFTYHELAPGVMAAVVDPGVPSYAFANSLIVIGEDGVLMVGRYLGDLDTLRLTPPTRLVDGRLHLDIGGREVVLFGVGPAHTPGDLVVWLPDEAIVMAGDLLEEGELWLGADIAGWATALGTLVALEPETLVIGHGGVQADLELLQAQGARLRELANQGSGNSSE
jgi:glyoxylase-like metal-dependent hydrolase (beta-lactamase superfamily II)